MRAGVLKALWVSGVAVLSRISAVARADEVSGVTGTMDDELCCQGKT